MAVDISSDVLGVGGHFLGWVFDHSSQVTAVVGVTAFGTTFGVSSYILLTMCRFDMASLCLLYSIGATMSMFSFPFYETDRNELLNLMMAMISTLGWLSLVIAPLPILAQILAKRLRRSKISPFRSFTVNGKPISNPIHLLFDV